MFQDAVFLVENPPHVIENSGDEEDPVEGETVVPQLKVRGS